MSKTAKGLEPRVTHDLVPRRTNCPQCSQHMRAVTV
jgi:hypothetical protein